MKPLYLVDPGTLEDVETFNNPASALARREELTKAGKAFATAYCREGKKLTQWEPSVGQWFPHEDTSDTPIKILIAAKLRDQ